MHYINKENREGIKKILRERKVMRKIVRERERERKRDIERKGETLSSI